MIREILGDAWQARLGTERPAAAGASFDDTHDEEGET